ncbi:MAG: 50S ribosomal protein L29 [Phycisphaeraceae bacterium]|nr:50S ribosomal protein L29 [Phycisphaerales bacterium]MCB9860282.1 50S ribosomal protein L29 [Phycisphaeraceae bacterium]
MTPKEIRKLDDEALALELKETRSKLFDLRMKAVTDKVDDSSQFGKLRKDVARMKTEMTARRKPVAS